MTDLLSVLDPLDLSVVDPLGHQGSTGAAPYAGDGDHRQNLWVDRPSPGVVRPIILKRLARRVDLPSSDVPEDHERMHPPEASRIAQATAPIGGVAS